MLSTGMILIEASQIQRYLIRTFSNNYSQFMAGPGGFGNDPAETIAEIRKASDVVSTAIRPESTQRQIRRHR